MAKVDEEVPERAAVSARAAEQHERVTGVAGELVQSRGPAVSELDRDRVGDPLPRAEAVVVVAGDDRRTAAVDVQLRLGDDLMVSRRRFGERGPKRPVP